MPFKTLGSLICKNMSAVNPLVDTTVSSCKGMNPYNQHPQFDTLKSLESYSTTKKSQNPASTSCSTCSSCN